MHTLNCPHCPKAFTKEELGSARAALQMHIGRKHTGTIPNATATPANKAAWAVSAAKARASRIAQLQAANPVAETPPVKRVYRKRQPVMESTEVLNPPQIPAIEIRINFCPNCGCDIHKFAVGRIMAGEVKP